MANKQLNLTNVLILAAVSYGGYRWWDSYQNGSPISPNELPVDPLLPSPKPAKAASTYPIERGSRGELVVLVQRKLGISADGIFGHQTENALVQRTGKSRIANAAELQAFLGTSVASSGSATPAAPAAPAPATSSAAPAREGYDARYGTFPLKLGSKGQYVRNLQKHLGLSVDGTFGAQTMAALKAKYKVTQVETYNELDTWINGKPAASTSAASTSAKPASTPTPQAQAAYEKKLFGEMGIVFNAIYSNSVMSGKTVYRERTLIDSDAIGKVLATMNDSYLKGFNNAYNRSFKPLVFFGNSRPASKASLLGDLSRVVAGNYQFKAQLARVKKL